VTSLLNWQLLPLALLALAVALALVTVVLRRASQRAESSLARSEALTRQLEVQAYELRRRVEESEALRTELELANIELVEANAEAHHARSGAEAAVRRKEEVLAILDTVLESSPVAFALCDRDLRFIRINRAFAGVTGRSITSATRSRMWRPRSRRRSGPRSRARSRLTRRSATSRSPRRLEWFHRSPRRSRSVTGWPASIPCAQRAARR
jgi:PAS domain-containing protein